MIKKLEKLFDKEMRELGKLEEQEYMLGSEEEERKYFEHNKDRFVAVLEEIEKYVNLREGGRMLDVGTSPLSFLLKRMYPQLSIETIDYDDKFQKRCRRAGIDFRQVDLGRAKISMSKGKYDAVLFLEVLEHLRSGPAHRRATKAIVNSIKKGGICVLQTPNTFSPKKMAMNTAARVLWGAVSDIEEQGGVFVHHKEYSLSELVNFVGEIEGVEILKAAHQMYFDTIESAMVYRKSGLIKPLLWLNYGLVKTLPGLRRGMVVVFRLT